MKEPKVIAASHTFRGGRELAVLTIELDLADAELLLGQADADPELEHALVGLLAESRRARMQRDHEQALAPPPPAPAEPASTSLSVDEHDHLKVVPPAPPDPPPASHEDPPEH